MNTSHAIAFLAERSLKVASGCIEWQGPLNPDGYGALRFERRQWSAHRLSWVAHHGEISKHLFVCHRCDNRRCCNIEHLWLGTHVENMLDKAMKGRVRTGSRPLWTPQLVLQAREAFAEGASLSAVAKLAGDEDLSNVSKIVNGRRFQWVGGPRTSGAGRNVRGADHPAAELTEAQVVTIRERRAAGVGLAKLAADYGVGVTTISMICIGTTWTEAGGPRTRRAVGRKTAMTPEVIKQIREAYAEGETLTLLAPKYDLAISTLSRICLGQIYPDAPGPISVPAQGRRPS